MSQETKTKATSLEKITAALTEHGWVFTVTEQEVHVPDQENASYHRYSSRAAFVPNKKVPGFEVKASNGSSTLESWYGDRVSFTAYFTESGAFLPRYSTGSYPIGTKPSVAKIVSTIEKKSPKAIEARQQANAEAKAAELAAYDAKVATAYAEAQRALTQAQGETAEMLMAETGMTDDQARAVLVMVQTGKFGPLLNASTQVERTAQGWIGESYCPATYVDGKRVSGREV